MEVMIISLVIKSDTKKIRDCLTKLRNGNIDSKIGRLGLINASYGYGYSVTRPITIFDNKDAS